MYSREPVALAILPTIREGALSYHIALLYNGVVFQVRPRGTMNRRALGEFEHQVLLCILRNGSESYSVEVVLELEARTGKEVATAAVFVALQRLREKGFLKDRLVEPGSDGGHARRYFRLTPLAVEALAQARGHYLRLWEGVESLLDEV